MNVLELENIGKSFDHSAGKITVLSQLNAQVAAGESVAIVGPSGSGKSTLLSLMAGLDRPDEGRMICLGTSFNDLDEQELTAFRANSLSIIFQQFRLMPHMTALENVRLPLDLLDRANSVDKARQALEQVGLGDRQAHFPRELSGGECQRVAIARAIVTEPKILLADEPSGNLDDATGVKVMDLLFKLVEQLETAVVLVTHDTKLAERCQRTLSLSRGRFD
jgi:putative ABC transport system ATP-binding protein